MSRLFRSWKPVYPRPRRIVSPKARLFVRALENRIVPATFVVSNTGDAGTGSGHPTPAAVGKKTPAFAAGASQSCGVLSIIQAGTTDRRTEAVARRHIWPALRSEVHDGELAGHV